MQKWDRKRKKDDTFQIVIAEKNYSERSHAPNG